MGHKSSKRTDPRSSIVPVEKGVIKKSGGGIAGLPAGYGELLGEIKARIARSRIEAALAANHVLIDLYWHIGRSIVERQKLQGWGKSVVEQLARDIQAAFPGIPGFSQNNIWRMRAFYLAYTEEVTILSQPVTELERGLVVTDLKAGAFKPEDAGGESALVSLALPRGTDGYFRCLHGSRARVEPEPAGQERC